MIHSDLPDDGNSLSRHAHAARSAPAQPGSDAAQHRPQAAVRIVVRAEKRTVRISHTNQPDPHIPSQPVTIIADVFPAAAFRDATDLSFQIDSVFKLILQRAGAASEQQ